MLRSAGMAQAKSNRARAAKKARRGRPKSQPPSATARRPSPRDGGSPGASRSSSTSAATSRPLAGVTATPMANHWSEDGVADIVPLGILRGRTEIVGLFRDLFAAVPDLQTTVTRDRRRRATGRGRMAHGRPFHRPVLPGRRADRPMGGTDVASTSSRSPTARTESAAAYYDGMSFARQVGLMPAQDSAPERAMKGALNTATKLRRTVRSKARTRMGGR